MATTIAETAVGSLQDQVASNPEKFVVLLSYDEFTKYFRRTWDHFEHETRMELRSQGVLGYVCQKTVVVFPVE